MEVVKRMALVLVAMLLVPPVGAAPVASPPPPPSGKVRHTQRGRPPAGKIIRLGEHQKTLDPKLLRPGAARSKPSSAKGVPVRPVSKAGGKRPVPVKKEKKTQ